MQSQLIANPGATPRHKTLIFAVGLMTLLPFTASAQIGTFKGSDAGPLTCFASAAGTPQLRPEGYTELLSDITITCKGGREYRLGSDIPTTNITVSVWPALSVTRGLLNDAS